MLKKIYLEGAVSTLIWLFAASYAALVVSPVNLLNPTELIIDFFGNLFDRFFQ